MGDDEQPESPPEYRDKRTASFAAGERVREFQAFRDQAERRLDILEAATNRNDLMRLPSNRFEALSGNRKGQFWIRINQSGAFASSGPTITTDRLTLRSPTIIEKVSIVARDPIHPGRFLADELEALHLTPTQMARALHVPPNRIYQILSGKRAMTADTALRLSQWLGTSPELWMTLQKLYELRLAEQQVGEEIRHTVAPWQPSQPGPTIELVV